MNLLMMYTAIPHTTAAYLEKALRHVASVRTCGPTISPGTVAAWNLEMIADRVRPHDQECGEARTDEILEGLGGFSPDWLLFIESGVWFKMPILDDAPFPKACYLIDTHLFPSDHLAIASRFDVVFLAQRSYVDLFREKLCRPVYWLPLAADPSIHRPVPSEERFDIGICGSESSPTTQRSRRLSRLALHYSVGKKRVFLEEMSAFLSECRLLFNSAVRNDLNMRVFESLAIGKCLLTDSVSGLSDLFIPDRDLIVYDDGDLIGKVQFLLDHPEIREQVARNGREKVLSRHTYLHRARSIVRMLTDFSQAIHKGEEHAAHSYI